MIYIFNIKRYKDFLFKPINLKFFILFKKISYKYNKYLYGHFGRNSIIQKPIMIYNKKHIFIGNNVNIRIGLRIEPITNWINQTFKPKIIIGNNTTIEQYCHITCANKVIIGNDVVILGFVMITDINHEYGIPNKGILQQSLNIKKTYIGDESFIGMGAKIMAGVKIGKHCIVGANSVVTKNIPDYSVVVGIPAKIIKHYDFGKKEWIKV